MQQKKMRIGDVGWAIIKAAKGVKGKGWIQKQLDFYYKRNKK